MPELKEFRADAFADIRAEVIGRGQLHSAPRLVAMRRRRTNRWRAAGVAAVAVGAVVAVVAGAQFGAARLTPPDWTPVPTARPALPAPVIGSLIANPATLAGSVICQRIPLDVWETYVIARLPDGKFALGRTLDAGKTWTAGVLPPDLQRFSYTERKPCTGIEPGALATHPTVVNGQTIFLGTMVTRDGGATWAPAAHGAPENLPGQNAQGAPVRPAIGAPVADPPVSWPIRQGSAPDGSYAVDPATNVYHPLVHQPPAKAQLRKAANGSWWATYRIGPPKVHHENGTTWATDAPDRIAVSDDHGRTWRKYVLPNQDDLITGVATLDGLTGYAVVTRGPSDGSLLVTKDAGRTWTSRPLPSVVAGGMPAVLPDGTLLLGSGGQDQYFLVGSRDDGETFHKMPGTDGLQGCDDDCGAEPGSGRQTTANGAYTAVSAVNYVVSIKVSMDGFSWVGVPIPAGSRLAPEN
jgi:hypothetical protein